MARRRGGGRPTKLTPEIQAELCRWLRMGNYVETAAALCGLSKDTVYRWIRDGARQKSGAQREFSDAVKKAIAEAEAAMVGRIMKEEHWTATAWRLERRFPERWGRRKILDVTTEDTGGTFGAREASELSDAEARARILQLVNRAAAAAGHQQADGSRD